MTLTPEYLSLVGVYSAMAIYGFSFCSFAWDLARRSALVPVLSTGREELPQTSGHNGSNVFERIGKTLFTFGWGLHLLSVVFRGIAGGRVPWANMFEFGLTATMLIAAVYLASLFWRDLGFLGAFVSGFTLLALGVVTVNFYVEVVPLPPALQSAWLVIHVFVASLATAFFALGAALSGLQLTGSFFQRKRASVPRLLSSLPSSTILESLAYRLNVVGFVMWSFTLVAGAIWAERAWGRYWGWDVKEVWTFIIWVIFAGYIHARVTRGWRGSRAAWLSLAGFGAVIFNYTVVNIFFTGLHSYSGL